MNRVDAGHPREKWLSEHLYRFTDSCNVYVLVRNQQVVLIDFGSGDVLDWIATAGLGKVTDVLITHHHRDQVQGLQKAVDAGVRIWVPETEQDFFTQAESFWQAREIFNNYNTRQDRFTLLENISISGFLRDYERLTVGTWSFLVTPTPGHTPGSVTLLAEIDGNLSAFTGDLIATPGKLWSLAATQWTYNGCEGLAASYASLAHLSKRGIEAIYPSHGREIPHPDEAIRLLSDKIDDFLQSRKQYLWVKPATNFPYSPISSHVLHNLHSESDSYVLLSDSGEALIIDYGYDFSVGTPAGFDRGARKPWLYSIDSLKTQFNIQKISVAIPTHYHDDHVAGMNLLHRVEGTEIWASRSITEIISNPHHYDLPCLWYDPICVNRILPLAQPFRWNEYEICLYPLPGHTQYAVAVAFEVDGKRYLATGDQYQYGEPPLLNYVYQNRFEIGDYSACAALLRRLNPDILLTGHWGPQPMSLEILDDLECRAAELDLLHRSLLADEIQGLGAGGIAARIEPYQSRLKAGEPANFEVEIFNPHHHRECASLRFVIPEGWIADPKSLDIWLGAGSSSRIPFTLTPPLGKIIRRARIAIELTIGDRHFGQAAEALVDVI